MAGAGYKLFNTGDVLTAAQVNTYLQEQAVMRFANSTARTTALSGVLAEGMVSYLDDTNAVEVYNGSAWVGVGSSGDITGVTAGTGISGGGTSGDVTITNSMATAIDAKGDLIVGTGADTFARLAVGGTNGHTLQVDSSTATGLKWAAAAGGGKLLQVVSTTKTNTFTSTTANTWVDVTGLSVTITPTANTSKIYVMVSAMMATNAGGGFNYGRVLRDAQVLNVGDSANNRLSAGFGGMSPTADICAGFGYETIDEPATTSATTYKVQIYAQAGGAAAYINRSHTDSNTADYARLVSTITVFEIGA